MTNGEPCQTASPSKLFDSEANKENQVPVPDETDVTKKLFDDCNKDSQGNRKDGFTDARAYFSTHGLTLNVDDISKEARLSEVPKQRQTSEGLRAQLALYQETARAKRLKTGASTPSARDNRAKAESRVEPRVEPRVVAKTPLLVSTPKLFPPLTPATAVPPPAEAPPAYSAEPSTLPPKPAATPRPPVVPEKKPFTAESNEIRLAKERNLARQNELNERETKLSLKAKELRSRESKFEADLANLEKQKRATLEQLKAERDKLAQEKLAHRAQLDRVDQIDTEMTTREEKLQMDTQKAREELEELQRAREAELEATMQRRQAELQVLFKAKEDELEARIGQREAQLQQQLLQLQADRTGHERQSAALTASLLSHQQQLDAHDKLKAEFDARVVAHEAGTAELACQLRLLKEREDSLAAKTAKFEASVEKLQEREIQLQQSQEEHKRQVNQAKETITTSERLALKVARDQDVLKQQQQLLQAEREKFVSTTLDWEAFKEALIFENEKLKGEALLVAEERDRLEAAKRALNADKVAVLAEKTQNALNAQRLEVRVAEHAEAQAGLAGRVLEAKLTEERIKAELAQLEHAKSELSIREAALADTQATATKKLRELDAAEKTLAQQEEQLNEKRTWMEAELASVCKMKAEHVQKEAALAAHERQLEDERTKLQRIQKILAAEEEAALERDANTRKHEEEVIALMENYEKLEAELRLRETAVQTRSEELDMRFAQLQQFQKVFDT